MFTREIEDQIADLNVKLKQLKEQERKAKQEALNAFQKEWYFTISPLEKSSRWDRLYDDTIEWYTLSGIILNAEEYTALGGDPKTGSMNYLYNKTTKRIIMRDGGGSIYIPEDSFGSRGKFQDNVAEIYAKLGEFISLNPEGGDVTDIIVGNPNFRW